MDKRSANKLAKVFNKIRGVYSSEVVTVNRAGVEPNDYTVRVMICHIPTLNGLLSILVENGVYLYSTDILGWDTNDLPNNAFLANIKYLPKLIDESMICLEIEEDPIHYFSKKDLSELLNELIDAIESYPFERRSK